MGELYLDDLKLIVEGLEQMEEVVNGFGHLTAATVSVEIESAVQVVASYDGTRWSISTGPRS